jgi:hypothetical protein
MGSHWLNLTFRFLLELSALAAVGAAAFAGLSGLSGPLRWAGAILAPLVLMTLWGVFAVPNDPSRGGTPVVVVPGLARLLLELSFFACATLALATHQGDRWAMWYGAAVLGHYLLSWDRVLWLLRQ